MILQKRNTIIEFLFYISCASIFFVNSTIYPIIFAIFILVTNIYSISTKTFSIKQKWTLSLIIFMLWAIFVSIINGFPINESSTNLIKILVNLAFLFTVLNNSHLILGENFKSRIRILLEILIIISFFQYAFLFFKLEIYRTILEISNSVNAQIITSRPDLIFWGNLSKNLLATKVILVQILYLFVIFISKEKEYWRVSIIIAISLFNTIISMGRTAQLAYLGVLFFFFLYFGYKYLRQFSSKKGVKYAGVAIGTIFIIFVIYKIPSIFRINFTVEDGGYIRLIYWKTFITDIWKSNFIIGNGILSTGQFLEKYSPYYIGESNMHNVLLNNFMDFGLIGTLIYMYFLTCFFIIVYRRGFSRFSLILTLFVWVSLTSLQYVGYDNDLVILLSVLFLLSPFEKNARYLSNDI